MGKRILIIGQCSLHWGRIEFGNIGNYYIVQAMFEELRRVFPDEIIVTTMQFSADFCRKYKVKTLPLDLYYDFNCNNNLSLAIKEYEAVYNDLPYDSEYIKEVKKADLIIDFSGDIWGDNADFLGKDRFITGLYKDLTAQLLKPTVMLSGSPGPFNNQKDIALIKKTFSEFKLVINREKVSTRLLEKAGFDISNVEEFPCPSFLFKAANKEVTQEQIKKINLIGHSSMKIGVILCGWNFKKGPFDLWPRKNDEYDYFIKVIENLIETYHSQIYLMSHANAFGPPPAPFALKQGRDFIIMQKLKELLDAKGYSSNVVLLDGIYTPEITKGIIATFDMLISGRMHGAVAGLSQCIPTVMIDYGHEPKAHKLQGFAELTGMENYLADPNDLSDMLIKTELCAKNRKMLHIQLEEQIPIIQQNAKKQFDRLKNVCT